jgi:hypothetical protein
MDKSFDVRGHVLARITLFGGPLQKCWMFGVHIFLSANLQRLERMVARKISISKVTCSDPLSSEMEGALAVFCHFTGTTTSSIIRLLGGSSILRPISERRQHGS